MRGSSPIRSWRLSGLAVLGALATSAALPAGAACDDGSWVAGTVDLCAGELVYRDYVIDDFGAADGPPLTDPTGLLALLDQLTSDLSTIPQGDAYGFLPPDGAERYPSGEDNSADLVFLRMTVDATQVHVTFELNTLFDPTTTLAAIAIDSDDSVLTGGGAWPGLTVRDGIFPLPDLPLTSLGWDVLHVFGDGNATVDVVANTIQASFPRPSGSTWRIQAVTARSDGRVMNAAFRGADETGFWWERLQSQALGSGDISGFGHGVDVADLVGGVTQESAPPAGAIRQRVYTSAHNPGIGEGLDHDGEPGPGFTTSNGAQFYSQAFNFLGRYQPYGFYEPDQPGPHGVQVMLHGLAENHSARLFFPGPNSGAISDEIGEAHNRLLIAPLGRGWKNWWSNYAERDALDALQDVIETYPVDETRLHLSGYSMGGYGTYRIGSQNPDRWASAIVWVGAAGEFLSGVPFFADFSATGAEGDVLELIGGFRHLPTAMIYSAEDELVPLPTALAVRDQFAAMGTGLGGDAGYESIHYLHPTAEHLTYVLIDDWSKESSYTTGRTLVADPARVTFQKAPQSSWSDPLGMPHDSAYWLSGIDADDPDAIAEIEARSYGCGDPDPLHDVVADAGVGPAPLAWVSQEVTLLAPEPVDPNQCLELELVNVSSLEVELGATCLGPATPSWRIQTDGPATVHLDNGDSLVLPGAGSFSGGPDLAVSPAAALVRVGQQAQFGAQVHCAEDGAVTWSVQEPDGGTIDASGLYTAPAQLTADGLAHVVATSVADGSVTGVATVHLRQNGGRR